MLSNRKPGFGATMILYIYINFFGILPYAWMLLALRLPSSNRYIDLYNKSTYTKINYHQLKTNFRHLLFSWLEIFLDTTRFTLILITQLPDHFVWILRQQAGADLYGSAPSLGMVCGCRGSKNVTYRQQTTDKKVNTEPL